jgi:hypothetical protein
LLLVDGQEKYINGMIIYFLLTVLLIMPFFPFLVRQFTMVVPEHSGLVQKPVFPRLRFHICLINIIGVNESRDWGSGQEDFYQ